MYDRQRCSEMCESLIPHFNYSKIVWCGSFLLSFIEVAAKNAKLLNSHWNVRSAIKGRGTHVWEAKVQ